MLSYLLVGVDAVVGLHYEGVLRELEAVRGEGPGQEDLTALVDAEEAGRWVDTNKAVDDLTLR